MTTVSIYSFEDRMSAHRYKVSSSRTGKGPNRSCGTDPLLCTPCFRPTKHTKSALVSRPSKPT